jgi:hypothetical protein
MSAPPLRVENDLAPSGPRGGRAKNWLESDN